MVASIGKKRLQATIIIRKHEIVEAGHHGGAWKVAYADFVTAMMAFFLLMWLLNATTEDQRKGLADYFSPNNILSHSSSGVGQPFGGHTAFDEGALVSDRGKVDITVGKRPVLEQVEDGNDPVYTEYHRMPIGDGMGTGPLSQDQNADDDPDDPARGQPGVRSAPGPNGRLARDAPAAMETRPNAAAAAARAETLAVAGAQDASSQTNAGGFAAQREQAAFEQAAGQIRQAMQADPDLTELAKQVSIDITPNGLRVQIMDEIKLPMFTSGSSNPNDQVRRLVQKVVPILNKLNEPISIAGHTDAAPFPGPERTNWELSSERANATRRLLVDSGLAESRIASVAGHADREPLLPNEPLAAANRRIAILVQRQAPANLAGH